MGISVRESDRAPVPGRKEINGGTDTALALIPTEDLLYQNLDLAEHELHRRLSDETHVRRISDATLVRLVTDLIKLSDRRIETPRRQRVTNILAIVQQEGLPPARQLQVISKAIEQAREAGEPIEQFEQALRQLRPPTERETDAPAS